MIEETICVIALLLILDKIFDLEKKLTRLVKYLHK